MLAALAVGAPETPDREVPASSPTAVPTATATATAAPDSVEAAFGVFRRPATAEERAVKPMREREGEADARLIATTSKLKHFLAKQGDDLCMITTTIEGRMAGGGCGPADTYLDGHRPQGSFSDQEGPSSITFAFPDGVDEVTLTLADGSSATYPVTTNGFTRDIPARAVRLEWRAPDGKPEKIDFHAAPAFRAQDFYSELDGPGEDAIAGLPGSRRIMGDGSTWVILVPRRGAVCLVVQNGSREASGCRRKVADVRDPLVVGLDLGGGRRAIAAAFANGFSRIEIGPDDGLKGQHTDKVLLVTDDGRAGPDAELPQPRPHGREPGAPRRSLRPQGE